MGSLHPPPSSRDPTKPGSNSDRFKFDCTIAQARPTDHNTPRLQQRTNNAKTVESLAGLIERVTYFSDESGYAFLKIKAKGHRDLVTVVGSLPSVSAGEWVTGQGIWVRDVEFGLQFKAEMLTSTPPTTIEGIEK